jgi:hypothetical protein
MLTIAETTELMIKGREGYRATTAFLELLVRLEIDSAKPPYYTRLIYT